MIKIDKLLAKDKINEIIDLFSFYSQTISDINSYKGVQIEKASVLSLSDQLFEFLIEMHTKIPIGQILYCSSVKYQYYDSTIQAMIEQHQAKTRSQNDLDDEHLHYLTSLKEYYSMIDTEYKIRHSEKIHSFSIQRCTQVLQKNIGKLWSSCYQKYKKKFAYLCQKLSFSIQKSDSKNNNNYQNPEINLLQQISCCSEIHPIFAALSQPQQKQTFIHQYFLDMLKSGQIDSHRIQQLNTMYLLYLSELQAQPTSHKIEIYTNLLALKVLKQNKIEIKQQLSIILELGKPNLEAIVLLMHCLIQVRAKDTNIGGVLEQILKIYLNQPEYQSDKSYIHLVILTSIANRMKNGVANRRQLVENLFKYPEIISLISHVKVIDFLIGLIFSGNTLPVNIGLVQSNISELFSMRLFEKQLQNYLGRVCCSEQDLNEPQTLLKMLKLLLARRNKIAHNYEQILRNDFLDILVFVLEYHKLDESLLRRLLLILQELNQDILCKGSHIRSEISRLYYSLLLNSLWSCKYWFESIICLELSQRKINFQALHALIKSQAETKFVLLINKQEEYFMKLFECIMNYDTIQIFVQVLGVKVGQAVEKWVRTQENHEIITENKKKRIIQMKRQRFLKILINRIGK